MRKTTHFLAVILLAFGMTAGVQATPLNTEDTHVKTFTETALRYADTDQWDGFSENLIVALKSDHDGLKVAAMGMVIRFGDKVDVGPAVFDVMRIYRSHPNENMRRMALVTLGQMESTWAIDFLARAEQFEQSPVLKQTLQAVVNDYHLNHGK